MTASDDNRTLVQCEPFRSLNCWVLWRLEAPRRVGAKPVKVQVHHDGSRHHSLPDPATPMPAALAQQWLAWCHATGAGHDRAGEIGFMGLGFRPEGTGLACLDIDDCLTPQGQWSPRAQEMMTAFPGSLVELSVSGKGLHIWFTYVGEGPGRKPRDRTGTLELYAAGQFVALGRVLAGDARIDATQAMETTVRMYWPAVPVQGVVTDADYDSKDPLQRAKVAAELMGAFPLVPQDNYDDWMRAGCALKSMGDDGFELWHKFSSLHPDYDELEVTRKWHQLAADRTDYRAIFATAQRNGWVNPESTEARISAAMTGFAMPLAGSAPSAGVLPPPSAPAVAPLGVVVPTLAANASGGGLIASSPANVLTALEQGGETMRLALDKFRAAIMIGAGGNWREMHDDDVTSLRVALERSGFKAVSAEVAKSCARLVARSNEFDSALQWGGTLVWDGQPRVTGALTRYYGVPDSPYVRAVSEYLFTALASRLMDPGCQADMVPVFVGPQGLRKTSSIAALAPFPEAFIEINLGQRDDNLARRLRGKLVAELAELRGLGNAREIEGIRAWVTRRNESWVPKWQESEMTLPRRFISLGTANGDEFLDDAEGERRWLPVRVTHDADTDSLKRDIQQLWAEGIAMWRQGGQRWQAAQSLAKDEVHEFKASDPWADAIMHWLAGPPAPMMGFGGNIKTVSDSHFTTADVMRWALTIAVGHQDKAAANRVAKVLKGFGYVSKVMRVDGVVMRRWVKM